MDLKVGLVDDDFRTTANIKDLMQSSGIDVVLVARSGVDFFEQIASMDLKTHPDIVLMDIDMPNMSGIDAVLIGKAKYPNIKYLMLTVYDDEEKLFQAIKAGASGYLLKNEKISVIIDHMTNLLEHGGVPMSPIMAQKTLNLIQRTEMKEKDTSQNFGLSDREIEVLKLMVNGKNYKEIGIDLFISKNTVKKHIANIYDKLHVSSKAQAIKMVHFYKLF